jgi:hypothetical protein
MMGLGQGRRVDPRAREASSDHEGGVGPASGASGAGHRGRAEGWEGSAEGGGGGGGA